MSGPPFKFTSYDLDSCVQVARVLHSKGGSASADELAVWLGYSGKNGSFLTRLANAKLFGLVEGPAGSLRPTVRALDILSPDYPASEVRAKLAAFEDVPLFKVVLDHYHGQPLPEEAGLKNALENRWGISSEKSAFVLSKLLDSAEQAGLFQTTGNRSKMIKPSFERSNVMPGPSPSDPGELGKHQGGASRSGLNSKLVEGALEMLPADTWDEEGLTQWLLLMEIALRVLYSLPKPGYPGELYAGEAAAIRKRRHDPAYSQGGE